MPKKPVIRVSESVPSGVVRFHNEHGQLIGEIFNLDDRQRAREYLGQWVRPDHCQCRWPKDGTTIGVCETCGGSTPNP